MKRLLFFFAGLVIGTPQAFSVPAYPHPVTYTQSDGTQITIRIFGDEFQHYALSSEGYTLVGGPDDDYYFATLAQDGTLAPTSVKARPIANLAPADRAKVSRLTKGVKPTAVSTLRMPEFQMQAPQTRADGKPTPPVRISQAQTKGKLKSLIILVNFKDVKYTIANPQQAIQNLLMQDGYSVNGATGSAWNYYQDNSNKQFDPDFVVVGPYTVTQTAAYYAGSNGMANASSMITEAAKLADTDVNFSEFANNGTIRDIFVFYAGTNQAEGSPNTVWPHRGGVGSSITLDGQRLYAYACSSELNGRRQIAGIGTFCHEFGHVLGWHDFYDTDYEGTGGRAPALESYSLMCSGSYNNEGRTPPAANILERWMVGWAEPEEIDSKGSYTLDPVWKDKGYLVRTPTTNDYFLIENRASGFKWDNYIINSANKAVGMLVYHVDYTSSKQGWWSSNRLNTNPQHECMKLVRSVPGAVATPGKTYFPGENNIFSLNPKSNKDYVSWNGEEPFAIFSDFSLTNDQIKLTVSGAVKISTTRVNQYDAVLSWEDPDSRTWEVSWNVIGENPNTPKTIKGTSIHLEGLTPGTDYKVTLTSTDFKGACTFSTKSISGYKNARIDIPESGFKSTEPILLSIVDFKQKIKSTAWTVDEKAISDTYLSLPAGEHKVMVTITATDGTKQHIIKYITVK